MRWMEYADREMMLMAVAGKIAGELAVQLAREERVTFVVPGGTTPGPIFDDLSVVDLDWERVDILLSDERWVPEDHPRSNTRLLRERLLKNQAAKAPLIPLYIEGVNAAEASEPLGKAVEAALPIGILLLGMGDDMHTASLFPGAKTLPIALSSDAPALVAIEAPGNAEQRITLSASILNSAISKHLVISGQEKRAALEKAQKLTPQEAPVQTVLQDMMVHWAP